MVEVYEVRIGACRLHWIKVFVYAAVVDGLGEIKEEVRIENTKQVLEHSHQNTRLGQ